MTQLLRGYTNVLTPINLLPNSDFSRGGGYPSTITASQLNSGSYIQVSENARLWCYPGTLYDITVVRSTNCLDIIWRPSSKSAILRLETEPFNIVEAGKLGTKTATIKVINDNIDDIHIESSSYKGSFSPTYYKNEAKDASSNTIKFTNIGLAGSSGGSAGLYISCPNATDGGTKSYHIQISDWCLYEGAYTNPPVYKSLDVQPSNQFYLASREYPNGYVQYQSSPIAMYNKAQWGTSKAVSFFEHTIHGNFSKGTGTKKLVFHKTSYGVGNADNSILIGRFAITYTTTNSSQRAYGYAYDFYYQIFGSQDTIAGFNGKLTELYKASGLSVTPSIGYSLESNNVYNLYLEFPDNLTDWGGRIFMEYNISSDYGRVGTHTDYSFRQPYYL